MLLGQWVGRLKVFLEHSGHSLLQLILGSCSLSGFFRLRQPSSLGICILVNTISITYPCSTTNYQWVWLRSLRTGSRLHPGLENIFCSIISVSEQPE